ncbi:MAG: hypothetical protein M5R36_24355 [Deltaproteobacteria bacterium]|nr:hypothetical protein [Deltaproteobacteria bacterium]
MRAWMFVTLPASSSAMNFTVVVWAIARSSGLAPVGVSGSPITGFSPSVR